MKKKASGNKVTNRVVGASCAAVFAVYAAGYERTQSAANRLTDEIAHHRKAVPHTVEAVAPVVVPPPAAPTEPAEKAIVASITPKPVKNDSAPVAKATESQPSEPAPPAVEAAAPTVAPAPVVAPQPPPPPPPPAPAWKDGTYTGWGYSRHGNIEATVVVEMGRILSATISQCRTRYSCSMIDTLLPQVAQRQTAAVDYISGATQSSDAFSDAVAEALSKAK